MCFMKFTNEDILKISNLLVKEWSNQFENPPADMPVKFTISETGMLCANGVALFPAYKINPDSMSYELDTISLCSCDGEEFEIGIIWGFGAPPYMSFACKKTTIFAAP